MSIEAIQEDRRILSERVNELESALEKMTDLLTDTTSGQRGYSFYSWQRVYQLIKERLAPRAPAPKCPKCQSIFINIEYNVFVADGVRPIHRATCRECEYELTYKHKIADFEEFFTALPEAQPTNKEEPK